MSLFQSGLRSRRRCGTLEPIRESTSRCRIIQETDGLLAEVVERLRAGVSFVTAHQETGIPSRQISEFAAEHHADLIMLGTFDDPLITFFLGTLQSRTSPWLPCPVFTVRAPKGPDARHHNAHSAFKQIVVPVDFSDCSDALEYGTYIAKDLMHP